MLVFVTVNNYLVSFLLFLSFLSLTNESYWYGEKIDIENLAGLTGIHNVVITVDLTYIINNIAIIQSNCLDINFLDYATRDPLDFWVEKCSSTENSTIWLSYNFDVGGNRFFIEYGDLGLSSPPGNKLSFSSDGYFVVPFLSMCPTVSGWSSFDILNNRVFPMGSLRYDSISGIDGDGTHTHGYFASNTDNMGYYGIPRTSANVFKYGQMQTGSDHDSHNHEVDDDTEIYVYEPSFFKVHFCKRKYFEIEENMLLMYDGSSTPNGYAQFDDIIGKFIKGTTTEAEIGEWEDRLNDLGHVIDMVSDPSFPYTSGYTSLFLGTDTGCVQADHTHRITGTTNDHSECSIPYVKMPFVQTSNANEIVPNLVLLATEGPPFGYSLHAKLTANKFPMGSSVGEWGLTNAPTSSHVHESTIVDFQNWPAANGTCLIGSPSQTTSPSGHIHSVQWSSLTSGSHLPKHKKIPFVVRSVVDFEIHVTLTDYLFPRDTNAETTADSIVTAEDTVTDTLDVTVADTLAEGETTSSPPDETTGKDETTSGIGGSQNNGWVAAVVVSVLVAIGALCLVVAVVIVAVVVVLFLNRRASKNKLPDDKENLFKKDVENELLEAKVVLSEFLRKYLIDSSDIKIIRSIGNGISATVYKAEWEGKTVAYKLFEKIMKQDSVDSFEKEARFMLENLHPNIVHLYGLSMKGERMGIVMEYLEMGSLRASQTAGEVFTWETKYQISLDLAVAIRFLHRKNIVHRDIKTENLLIFKENNVLRAKISDLGLSKQQKEEQSATMAIGTFKYMSPELAIGDDRYEIGRFPVKNVDVYAMGITFVSIITGKDPYPELVNDMSIPSKVGYGKLKQEISPTECPPSLRSLINKCRDIDLAKRPDAETIVQELEKMKEEVILFEEKL